MIRNFRGGLLAWSLAIAAAIVPAPARAWGPEGHRIVGLVAQELLDARTRAALRAIAGDASLADVGLWMDEERERLSRARPGSARWHYDNRPVCAARATLADYCRDGNCASAAYARYRARLADPAASREARLEALRVVVHVLADVHQPLHVADDHDRGGNDVEVRVGRRSHPKSLHAAWDNDFVKRAVRGEPEAAFAGQLVAAHRAERARIEAGTIADWMQESYELARHDAYGQLPGFACGETENHVVSLPADYSDHAAAIVAERLARAGIRLAAVLRGTL